ncbi:MMPL family transporter [Peribacillus sp. SCS-155]|uniref:MMPL family transporter n=1 Tax=Peribacillus sedimenti TaxID=3115297 RepID=UPI003906076D
MSFFAKHVVKYYKIFLGLWLLFTIILGMFALKLPDLLGGDGFETDGEFKKVEKELTETFGRPESTLLVLFEKPKNHDLSEFNDKIEMTLDRIRALDMTTAIQSPLQHQNLRKGDMSYAILAFDKDMEDLDKQIDAVRDVTGNDPSIKLTGVPIINQDFNTASQEDLKRAELIGLPFAILVLILAFGSMVASLVPIAVGAITIIASFGILSLAGGQVNLSVFILNIVPMIGLALSIDFSLLFINRYREEILHSSNGDAIVKTIQTAGRSIIFSAFCVFIGLAAIIVINVDIFKTIAIGGMVVVAIAVFSSLTLLPSILMLLGANINKWSIITVKDKDVSNWRRLAKSIMRRPAVISVVSLLVLIFGMLPVKNMNLAIPKADSLPKGYESRIAFEAIQDRFQTDKESQVYVVAERNGDWLDTNGLEEMKRLENELQQDSLVSDVESLFAVTQLENPEKFQGAISSPEMQRRLQPVLDQYVKNNKLLVPVTIKAEDTSEAAKTWARDWSNKKWDYKLSIGGPAKFNQEIFDEIADKIGTVLAIILISTFIILTFAFRSIVIPVKAILMNVLGLSATFGILVWLFQYGHFGLPETDISLIIPVLVFTLVFGLSMDYEVFLISRIQEIYLESSDNDYATVEGLASTSKIITSAALIMIVITGAFAFTGVMPVKQIGIGIAIAIFIDATIIRLLLVPSLMKLLGDWNWWMPFSKNKIKKPYTEFK